MGLLDQYFDPATLEAAKQFGQPSEEDKIRARNAALGQMGFAMMANNRGHSAGQAFGNAFGNGGMAFNQAYQGSLDEAKQNQMQQFKMAGSLQGMQQEAAKRQRIAEFRNGLPEADRGIFDMAPDKFIENMPRFQKQQLVEVADPSNPNRTIKQWTLPGQSTGTVAGYGKIDVPPGFEIGPDGKPSPIQAYWDQKGKVAAAGKPNIETKIYNTAETEQAKVWGKQLGEVRSNIANNAFLAPAKLAKLDRIEQLLEGVDGGKLAPAGLELASSLNSMGIKIDPKLGNKEAAESLGIEMASALRPPGSGPMTDKDFENYVKTIPNLSKSAEGRKQIITTMRATLKRDQEAHKLASAYAKKRGGGIDDGFADELANFYASNPVVPSGNDAGGGFKIIGVR